MSKDPKKATKAVGKRVRVKLDELTATKDKAIKDATRHFKRMFQNIGKLEQAQVCATKVLEHLENQISTQEADSTGGGGDKVDDADVGEFINLADEDTRHKKYVKIYSLMEEHLDALEVAFEVVQGTLDEGITSANDTVRNMVNDTLNGESGSKYREEGVKSFQELEEATGRIRELLSLKGPTPTQSTPEGRRSTRSSPSELYVDESDDEHEAEERLSSSKKASRDKKEGDTINLAGSDDSDEEDEEEEGDGEEISGGAAKGRNSELAAIERSPYFKESARRQSTEDVMKDAQRNLDGLNTFTKSVVKKSRGIVSKVISMQPEKEEEDKEEEEEEEEEEKEEKEEKEEEDSGENTQSQRTTSSSEAISGNTEEAEWKPEKEASSPRGPQKRAAKRKRSGQQEYDDIDTEPSAKRAHCSGTAASFDPVDLT